MVAQRRGRGAKAQAAKAKAAAVEEEAPAMDVSDSVEDNNGVEAEEGGAAGAVDEMAEGAEGEGDQAEGEQAEEANDTEEKPEEKKEEPVESGKILVEKLPASYIFDYQDKLKELFSKYGEVTNVKRGPIVVTEQTTTPTLSAIVEFKNKDSLEKAVGYHHLLCKLSSTDRAAPPQQALAEHGTVLDGASISVAVESRADCAVLVGLPYEASVEYVRLLFSQCGEVAQILEFSKTKYKILRVTFQSKESVEKALKLDRELRINGFLVTVARYQDDIELKQNNSNKNKRPHPQNQNANQNQNRNMQNQNQNNSQPPRNNNFRGGRGGVFNARGNFRGGRGRGVFPARGGFGPRGGFAGINSYMPPAPYMQRPNPY